MGSFSGVAAEEIHGCWKAFRNFLFPASCRYLPSCSDYALEAVNRYGAFRGLRLAFVRVLRCHPWGGSGHDPVP